MVAILVSILFIREEKGITQKDIAARSGYKSTGFINKIENLLEPFILKHEVVEKIANELGIDVGELLQKRERMIEVSIKRIE